LYSLHLTKSGEEVLGRIGKVAREHQDALLGYIPTIGGAVRGGYGGASSMTWVAAGTGERMVNHSVVRVYEMLGKLTDTPM
jgi:hypothetical protein